MQITYPDSCVPAPGVLGYKVTRKGRVSPKYPRTP